MHYNVLQWHNGTKMASKIIGAEYQGCINCAILPSGMGARGVSSEHVENMKMFSTEVFVLQFSNLGAFWLLENRALVYV